MGSKQEPRDLETNDRISSMPDLVLCNILSHLPTGNAVAASILSTRWSTLFPFFWNPSTSIVINLDNTCDTRERNEFAKFVDKLLHETLVDATCIGSFNLKWRKDYHEYDEEKIITWVSWALRHNVRELSLEFQMDESKPLFHILNGCTTLTSLELGASISRYSYMGTNTMSVEFLDGFTLPSLKKLVLSRITSDYNKQNSLNELINCFCALECLSLSRCELGKCLFIESPTLENLTIETIQDISSCVLKIDAPKLKVLQYVGETAKSVDIVNDFKYLVSAHIDIDFHMKSDGVKDFVTACSSIVRLYLSTNMIHALLRSGAKLPVLRNLRRLALGHIQLKGWAILAELLCNSPNLEKLTFEQGLCLQEGGFSTFIASLSTSPPICLKHKNVKEIELWTFNETEDEIKLIEYFLNNCEDIETIKLRCLPYKHNSKRQNTLRKLSELPNQSKLVRQPKPKSRKSKQARHYEESEEESE